MINVCKHIRTGNMYTVLEHHAEMKLPVSGNWEHCIIYEQIGGDRKRYVREKHDFWKKFERVEQPKL